MKNIIKKIKLIVGVVFDVILFYVQLRYNQNLTHIETMIIKILLVITTCVIISYFFYYKTSLEIRKLKMLIRIQSSMLNLKYNKDIFNDINSNLLFNPDLAKQAERYYLKWALENDFNKDVDEALKNEILDIYYNGFNIKS